MAFKYDTFRNLGYRMSPSTGQAKLPLASEFYQLSLLLAACTALNRADVFPTFTARAEEEWAWHHATQLDPYPRLILALTNILERNHLVLAGMEITSENNGLEFVVLPSPSKGSEDLDLNHFAVIPDGVDHWATTKMTQNGLHIFDLDE